TDPNILVIPSACVICQLGRIVEDTIFHAKRHTYYLDAFRAGNYLMASQFRNAPFVTIYLSP
ncbi:phosphatidylserine decarboxylase, partial [Salmonella enterica]|uniref:phosphatidylserine decarboxylase n=1 Tax=Salmonella enterica TaxID=28901 RepID=UPI00398C7478